MHAEDRPTPTDPYPLPTVSRGRRWHILVGCAVIAAASWWQWCRSPTAATKPAVSPAASEQ